VFTVKIKNEADELEGVEAVSWRRGVNESGRLFVEIEQLEKPDRSGKQDTFFRRVVLGEIDEDGRAAPSMVIIENRMGETTQVIKRGKASAGSPYARRSG
jgi:hypothetical protein